MTDGGTVAYAPGPDPTATGSRYGLDLAVDEARALQRLESTYGHDRVKGWVDEGMPIESMGKPRSMQAYRDRERSLAEKDPSGPPPPKEGTAKEPSENGKAAGKEGKRPDKDPIDPAESAEPDDLAEPAAASESVDGDDSAEPPPPPRKPPAPKPPGTDEASLDAPVETAEPGPEDAGPAPTGTTTGPDTQAAQPRDGKAPGGGPATEGDTAPRSPDDDPAFQHVVTQGEAAAATVRAHPPADAASANAQAAAEGPANELESKAATQHVGELAEAEPEPFDRAAFKASLQQKIADTAPETLEEADEFKDSNQLGAVKGDLTGKVEEGKQQAQGPIEEKTEEPPDTSAVDPKPVEPMQPPEPSPPQEIDAAGAAPKPKSDAEVSTPFKERSNALDNQLATEGVTEEQLKKANEPAFTAAVEAKQQAQADAAAAPTEYRQHEKGVLDRAAAESQTAAESELHAMQGAEATLLADAGHLQNEAKGDDEANRAKVAAEIEAIYEQTNQNVEARLAQLDAEVDEAFDAGAERAREVFETYVDTRMRAYKEERYSGVIGKGKWVKDKLLGMPSEVEQFYVDGRDRYLEEMDVVLDRVVDIVETGLVEAKELIAEGRQAISDHVASLPASLQAVGQECAANIQTKFDQLEQTVDAKQDQLVDSLARKYNENLEQVDARIEELKAANRGLVDKAIDAVGGVIKTITQLKDMLFGVLSKATSAIETIIRDPVGFLDNLIVGVKGGLNNFVANIGKHLKAGLLGWLTGAVADTGIQLPDKLDLLGIFSIVMQVLGLTYDKIREKAVNVFGEDAVVALEEGFEIFRIMVTEGVVGLWDYIKDKIGDLQAMVVDKIKDMVVTQVIKSGIKWLIGLLSPAAAFIKACKAIYDIIHFIITRGRKVLALVEGVLDSVIAIAKGNVGGPATLVEDALARSISVVIDFLANLLGLGAIPQKVRGIIETVQRPIDKGVTWVLDQAKAFVKKIGGMVGIGDADEQEERMDDALDDSPQGQERRLEGGLEAAVQATRETSTGVAVDSSVLERKFSAIREQFGMTTLQLVAYQDGQAIHGEVNPDETVPIELPEIDIPAVQQQIAESEREYSAAQRAHEDLAAFLSAKDTKSAEKAKRGICFASANGTIRHQGGGTKAEARREADAAWRYTEAERIRWEQIGEAQKRAYMLLPDIPKEVRGESEDPLIKMTNSHEFMRELRERFADVAYFPTGHFADVAAGGVGAVFATHAEKLVHEITNATAIGVSKPMCKDCQSWFSQQASQTDQILVVKDPRTTRIFLPTREVLTPNQITA